MLDRRRSELILVGLLVWLILSAVVFIMLVLPFAVPQYQLASLIPECKWQSQFQKSCVFCGMSTAFYAISRSDFAEAHRLNPLSLYIYSVFLVNTIFVGITLKRSTRFVKSLVAQLRCRSALT